MSAPGADASHALNEAISELEEAAQRLRARDLGPDEAAALVERCAELAARVGRELDRTARAAAEPSSAAQETLL